MELGIGLTNASFVQLGSATFGARTPMLWQRKCFNASKHPHMHHGDFQMRLLSLHSRQGVNILPKIGSHGVYSVNSHTISKSERTEVTFHKTHNLSRRVYFSNRAYRENAFLPSIDWSVHFTARFKTNRIIYEVDALIRLGSFNSSGFIAPFSADYCKQKYRVSELIHCHKQIQFSMWCI